MLAIETSGPVLGLAVFKNGSLAGEMSVAAGRRHSEILAASCQKLLKRTKLQKSHLTHLAVDTGPGSFTGLRVGIAFARTLAQFLKIPLVGISLFEILARQEGAERAWITLPSIGEDVYVAKPQVPYRVLPRPELERELARATRGKISLLDGSTVEPSARVLAELALERIAAKRVPADSWKKIFPLYLRPSIAQERKGFRKKK
ncbi:MAG: tRNA (adenosine(37)-N6)-threonylcarbamoyltransferase complex dimerization subunit type 1 TsaB [Elusimicrobia bacterium RIFCSPLOWO2_01_FULL_54_10]|nr:MAG: tRNA (adenosine(37)-N6)-threonylcarbamoyltransferase complex dimerization subunit type 1 TsaB [Elusimicrobia bacterium RIFCSPLOWO2_01_FULL_54_10]